MKIWWILTIQPPFSLGFPLVFPWPRPFSRPGRRHPSPLRRQHAQPGAVPAQLLQALQPEAPRARATCEAAMAMAMAGPWRMEKPSENQGNAIGNHGKTLLLIRKSSFLMGKSSFLIGKPWEITEKPWEVFSHIIWYWRKLYETPTEMISWLPAANYHVVPVWCSELENHHSGKVNS